jgi:hypothetical protein
MFSNHVYKIIILPTLVTRIPNLEIFLFCQRSQRNSTGGGNLELRQTKLGAGCKDTLVICNSIFFIFLNQIKAQRDQKIIVWVEYFPNKYSFKVISND